LRFSKGKVTTTFGAAALAPVAFLTWGFWIEPGMLVTRQVHLQIPGFQQNLRMAVLSDLHIGSPHVGVDQLRKIVEHVNAEKPDVVVMLGDFVTGGPGGRHIEGQFVEPERIADGLKDLHARLGVFAVLGNHDWWFDGERVGRALTGAGITVLENQAVRLGDGSGAFWLGGIADMWTRNPDVAGTLAQVQDDNPVVLFTHNPDIFPDVPARVNLTLGAHTHGGQIDLPFIGRVVKTSRFGYVAGYFVEENRRLFVTTGIGTSIMAIRMRVPPEIVIMTIAPEGATSASAR
jgi:predicted MPP superfamily phosphohydrolase